MQTVAVGWQVYSVTHSPLDLGLIGLSQFLPFIVLAPVPPHTTVAGVPAKPVGKPLADLPAFDMKQDLE